MFFQCLTPQLYTECYKPKNQKQKLKTGKIFQTVRGRTKRFELANKGNKLFDQKSPVKQERGLQVGRYQPTDNRKQTDIMTYRVNQPWGQVIEN